MQRNRRPMVIETMTVNQVVDALRGLGIRTSEERVIRLLIDGKYPWGVATQGAGERLVEIYAKKFWAWWDEIAEEDTEYLDGQKKTAQRLAPLDCPRPKGRVLKA